ncbi:hypothetical protein NPX13_g9365 [Xylaria arbuscula]|uniref:Uncharacterized protein n=1 Tax=Xylaria arbuscula TaxID=114810 RepID=A0A9W8THS5_9PEZI|nr:hypothetical protein NPX13_g9365 [Xylaria arbuscula]
MASSLACSTPSPPGTIHTPGTPKHGYNDPWEPFSPRKSARISSRQQSTNRTPSPRHTYSQSTRSSSKPSTLFSTPATSPIKKRQPTMDSELAPSRNKNSHAAASTSQSTGMLPTPAKTPRKQPNPATEAVSRNIARNLFASEDDMLTPKKKAKKYTGLTLDSFRAEDVEEDIEIFTDTRDHFPVADLSPENPFFGEHAVAEPTKRRSKRKPVVVPGEGKQSIEDAVKRDDGVLVVFRGKRMFRKFAEDIDEDSSSQAEGDEAADSDLNGQTRRNRPMTRSSIKPRLLFPPAKGKKATTSTIEDEEAVTDIEDNVFNDSQVAEAETPQTPARVTKGKVETPDAPRFGPASPPSTGRATRSTDKLRGGVTPMKAKGPSPFDGWRRSKSRAAPQGQKRSADDLAEPPVSAKRQRA